MASLPRPSDAGQAPNTSSDNKGGNLAASPPDLADFGRFGVVDIGNICCRGVGVFGTARYTRILPMPISGRQGSLSVPEYIPRRS